MNRIKSEKADSSPLGLSPTKHNLNLNKTRYTHIIKRRNPIQKLLFVISAAAQHGSTSRDTHAFSIVIKVERVKIKMHLCIPKKTNIAARFPPHALCMPCTTIFNVLARMLSPHSIFITMLNFSFSSNQTLFG